MGFTVVFTGDPEHPLAIITAGQPLPPALLEAPAAEPLLPVVAALGFGFKVHVPARPCLPIQRSRS